MKSAIDSKKTTEWALAPVAGFSFVASGQQFMLANRVTGRAHLLTFVGGGLTLGFTANVSKKLSYKSFRTSRPVNFDDFNGRGARITELEVKLGAGYSKGYFTIFNGSNPFGTPLGSISWGGWGFGKPSVKGQAAVHGAIAIIYGNGKPHGLISRVLDPDFLKEEYEPIPRIPHIRYKAREAPLLVFPGDVLFDFDRDNIKREAIPLLRRAMDMIESRKREPVRIVGHTDSKGSGSYNLNLSLNRARAVKRWFIKQQVAGAEGFMVEGKGEKDPLEPNTKQDGSDNPEGRAQNRRVEIHFN